MSVNMYVVYFKGQLYSRCKASSQEEVLSSGLLDRLKKDYPDVDVKMEDVKIVIGRGEELISPEPMPRVKGSSKKRKEK